MLSYCHAVKRAAIVMKLASLPGANRPLPFKINTRIEFLQLRLLAKKKKEILSTQFKQRLQQSFVPTTPMRTAPEVSTWRSQKEQRGDKRNDFLSPSDSRGLLVWSHSIRPALPSCGSYQLLQHISAVSPRARKCLCVWRQFGDLNVFFYGKIKKKV